MKPHMFIKADRLRILLVDSQFAYSANLDRVLKQSLAYAIPPVLGGNEKHFEFVAVHACKGNGDPVLFGDKQPRHIAQSLRHISFYAFDILLG